jgi:hypothetical protein
VAPAALDAEALDVLELRERGMLVRSATSIRSSAACAPGTPIAVGDYVPAYRSAPPLDEGGP